jgi:hypothetical protein
MPYSRENDLLQQAAQRLHAADKHLRTDDAARRACLGLLDRCVREAQHHNLDPVLRAVALEVARTIVDDEETHPPRSHPGQPA